MINKELTKRIVSSLILIPLSIILVKEGNFLFNIFILICFLITSYEWHIMSRKKTYHLLGFFFLLISFFTAYEIRAGESGSYESFVIILLICIATDIGGYIFGKIFKGPKLTKISPNKTYSGAIGGYLLTIIFLNLVLGQSYFFLESHDITVYFIVFILFISTVSQLGDIIISYFKRLSKVKDTGKIIPGHGGLLDRLDGMIFAYPSAYLIFKINIFQF
tara:strand:+ start:530 stop:1186 length:657 start_codon:yes stop_codon:yes gene_type:complete